MVRAMYRPVLVAVVALAACNQTENNRPATLEYITEAILQPSCAQYTCHSSYRVERGMAFDTVEAARRALHVAVPKLPPLVVKGDVDGSGLNIVLTRVIKR